MASVTWPYDLCNVVIDDYELDDDENVQRTPFESGEVAQVKRFTRVQRTRTFDVQVKESNVVAFREWVNTNGFDLFNFRDWEDQIEREGRIRGGRVPLSRVRDQRLDGERFFTGRVVVEGYH